MAALWHDWKSCPSHSCRVLYFRWKAMKEIARHIFDHALRESSIQHAFARNVSCDRGVLRICEDLYDLNAYSRVFVIAIGKAAHSMITALHEQTGERFQGIVASSVEPQFHIRGFRYFHGG